MSQSSEYFREQREEAEANHEAERERMQARITELEEALAEAEEREMKLQNAARELRKALIIVAEALPE